MLKAQPTPKGTGVSIFGSYDDLICLYDTVHHLAGTLNPENKCQKGQHQLLMNLAYEIRKGYSGSRLKETVTTVDETYFVYGFQLVWTDVIIFIGALRDAAGYIQTDKLHQANLYMFEYIVERALFVYDPTGAEAIRRYIAQRVNVSSEYVFIIYQAIHIEYNSDRTGKTRFRKIPDLINKYLSTWSPDHKGLIASFQHSAKEQNCEVVDLEFSDFPEIKW